LTPRRIGLNDNGGTIFSIGTNGSNFTVLHSFAEADGVYPYGSLTLSGSTLYGMASQDGANNYGTISLLSQPFSQPVPALSLPLILILMAVSIGLQAVMGRKQNRA